VTTYAQIAAFSPEDIVRVDDKLSFKGRIERDDWMAQATKLMSATS
jgi:predicted flap endonuclease-1-like 5' DNA nuclease